jgi:hypothetical protein
MPSRLLLERHKVGCVLLLGTVILLTACGGSPSSGSSPTSTATHSASPTETTPSPTPSTDVAAAGAAALTLYSAYPNNVNDPSAGYIWSDAASMPVSSRLRDRLLYLTNHGYFADTKCGEDYVDGNQVGLTRAPTVISADPNPDGTVTVVIRGYLNDAYRDLTVVMSQTDGAWLAIDLRRGTGPNASIFSDQPNC